MKNIFEKLRNLWVITLFWKLLNCSSSQLQEIAIRLQASGKNFIWVVKKSSEDDEE